MSKFFSPSSPLPLPSPGDRSREGRTTSRAVCFGPLGPSDDRRDSENEKKINWGARLVGLAGEEALAPSPGESSDQRLGGGGVPCVGVAFVCGFFCWKILCVQGQRSQASRSEVLLWVARIPRALPSARSPGYFPELRCSRCACRSTVRRHLHAAP